MANLIVTGGAGFIGANFVHHHRRAAPGDTIVILDALTYAGHRTSLDGVADIEFVHGDIGDTDLAGRLIADHAIDTIVHFAAESHVDRSITGPDAFVTTNVLGTQGGEGGVARRGKRTTASFPPSVDRRGVRLARAH